MKNADLSFDQLVKELMKLSEEDSISFAEFRASVVRELQKRGLSHG
jgi:hypothetical protein